MPHACPPYGPDFIPSEALFNCNGGLADSCLLDLVHISAFLLQFVSHCAFPSRLQELVIQPLILIGVPPLNDTWLRPERHESPTQHSRGTLLEKGTSTTLGVQCLSVLATNAFNTDLYACDFPSVV